MAAILLEPTVPAIEGEILPKTDAQICAQADLNAANRVKGFLGMTGEIVPSLPADPVAYVKALTDAELFSAGEKALRDIADDLIILDEIRNRFRAANGRVLLGYQSWKFSIRRGTIQQTSSGTRCLSGYKTTIWS